MGSFLSFYTPLLTLKGHPLGLSSNLSKFGNGRKEPVGGLVLFVVGILMYFARYGHTE